MLAVALGWQMYDLTHSAFSLGLIGLAQFLPQLLLTLVVGHAADRYNRRTIVLLCQLLEGMVALALAAGSLAHALTPSALYGAALLLGAARAFESPSLHSLLPRLLSADVLPRALALSAASMQSAVIAGPALGGAIYAFGSSYVYMVSALCWLVAALSIGTLPYTHSAEHKAPATLSSLFAGIAYIRSKPVVLGAISLDLFAVLLGGATALLPIFARDILHIGPLGLGLLRSAPAVGALGMSLYLAQRPLKQKVGKIMFAAVALFGLGTIVFGLSSNFGLSLLALLVLGASDMISVVIRSTLVQLETPDEMRGRVSAVNSVFIGTSNQLGEFESGLTAAWFGAVPAVVIGGIGTLVVVALWMRWFPELVEREEMVAQEAA
jgi:MFS family permease